MIGCDRDRRARSRWLTSGPGVQLEEQLNKAGARRALGRRSRPMARAARSPRRSCVIDADHLGDRLAAVAEQWRDQPSVPGRGRDRRRRRPRASRRRTRGSRWSRRPRSSRRWSTAIQEAAKLRLASGMRWAVLRAARKLPPIEDAPARVAADAARRAQGRHRDPAHRAALARHPLRDADAAARRAPRASACSPSPSSRPRRSSTARSPCRRLVRLGPARSAADRAVPVDAGLDRRARASRPRSATSRRPPRRMLARAARAPARARRRGSSAARSTTSSRSRRSPSTRRSRTAYRLVGAAVRAEGARRGTTSRDLAALVKPMWELVEKARSVLVDHAARGRYHDWLRAEAARAPHGVGDRAARRSRPRRMRSRAGRPRSASGDVHRR